MLISSFRSGYRGSSGDSLGHRMVLAGWSCALMRKVPAGWPRSSCMPDSSAWMAA
jgi:hypothetical protein